MARFLFATTPADGHTVPALPIARALVERGHSVRWYTGAKHAARITALGGDYAPMSDHDYSLGGFEDFFPERAGLNWVRAGTARVQERSNLSVAGPTYAISWLCWIVSPPTCWWATAACSPDLW